MTKITYIPGEIANAAIDEHGNRKPVTRTQHIFDDAKGKSQDVINQETDSEISSIKGGSTKSIANLDNEINGNGGIDERLGTVEQLAEISIGGGDAQIATGEDFDNPDATKRAKVPTVGAVLDGLNDGIYDVSKRNPSGGPNSDGKFTLEYILSNANTLIPTSWRHSGMSISFVQSSDNKYVQYRLMADEWSSSIPDWQQEYTDKIEQEIGAVNYENLSISYGFDTYSRYYYSGSRVKIKNTGNNTIAVRFEGDQNFYYIASGDFYTYQVNITQQFRITTTVGESSCQIDVLGVRDDIMKALNELNGQQTNITVLQSKEYYYSVYPENDYQIRNTGENTFIIYFSENNDTAFSLIGYVAGYSTYYFSPSSIGRLKILAQYGDVSATISVNGLKNDFKETIYGKQSTFSLSQYDSFESELMNEEQQYSVTNNGNSTFIIFHLINGETSLIKYLPSGGVYFGKLNAEGYVQVLAQYGNSEGVFKMLGVFDEISNIDIKKKDIVFPDSARIFERVGCIGDSYTAGYIVINEHPSDYPNYSWPHFLSKRTGRQWDNYGVTGSTAKSWISGAAKLNIIQQTGNKCQAYVIGLQINDADPGNPYYTPAGSTSDIGTDSDTYAAYYYKLVQAVVAVNPSAKIFCLTCPLNGNSSPYNNILKEIVTYCANNNQNVYLCDIAGNNYNNEVYFQNPVFVGDYINGHYTAIGYNYISDCLLKVISDTINQNVSDFQNIFEIPFDEV